MTKTKYMTMDQIAATLLWDGYKPTDKYKTNLIYYINIFDITNNDDLLAQLHKVNSKNPNVTKLVSQFEQALSEKTPEAKEFINSLNLFVLAFKGSESEDYRNDIRFLNQKWQELSKRINDKKILYNAIKVFRDWNSGNDYFEDTIVQELCVKNPHANAEDILWYCIIHNEPINSPIFQRGLKKFDEEFDEEAKKDKPDFTRILRGTWSVFQEHYIDASYSDVDTDSAEYVELVSRYSDTAINMRIHIAMLEKENKKLKAELRTKKTAGFAKGTTKIAKTTGAGRAVKKQNTK